MALAKVGKALRTLAEREAGQRKWGIGPTLSPGHLTGWHLSDQINLCPMLSLDEIDVHLNEQGVLIPLKSVSGVIGIGPQYKSKKVALVCRFCTYSTTCQWYQDDASKESPF